MCGSRGKTPRILHYQGVSGQFHAPATLPLEKSPRWPLDRRLVESQGRSGRDGENKSLAPVGNRNPLSNRNPWKPQAYLNNIYTFSSSLTEIH
jgi:hypothetical protein